MQFNYGNDPDMRQGFGGRPMNQTYGQQMGMGGLMNPGFNLQPQQQSPNILAAYNSAQMPSGMPSMQAYGDGGPGDSMAAVMPNNYQRGGYDLGGWQNLGMGGSQPRPGTMDNNMKSVGQQQPMMGTTGFGGGIGDTQQQYDPTGGGQYSGVLASGALGGGGWQGQGQQQQMAVEMLKRQSSTQPQPAGVPFAMNPDDNMGMGGGMGQPPMRRPPPQLPQWGGGDGFGGGGQPSGEISNGDFMQDQLRNNRNGGGPTSAPTMGFPGSGFLGGGGQQGRRGFGGFGGGGQPSGAGFGGRFGQQRRGFGGFQMPQRNSRRLGLLGGFGQNSPRDFAFAGVNPNDPNRFSY